LTMRTFHTGGVAGVDITQGLPRVEELFEARIPKGKAIIAEIDGELEIIRQEGARKVRVTSREEFEVSYPLRSEERRVGKECRSRWSRDQWEGKRQLDSSGVAAVHV